MRTRIFLWFFYILLLIVRNYFGLVWLVAFKPRLRLTPQPSAEDKVQSTCWPWCSNGSVMLFDRPQRQKERVVLEKEKAWSERDDIHSFMDDIQWTRAQIVLCLFCFVLCWYSFAHSISGKSDHLHFYTEDGSNKTIYHQLRLHILVTQLI